MAKYITSILKHAPSIVMSWGFHQSTVYEKDGMEGLRFRVEGFKHKGLVAVLYNPADDYFEVELQDNVETVKTRIKMICLTELVDCIDNLVERTDDYENDVREWINTPEADPDKQAVKDVGRWASKLQELGIPGEIVIIE